MVTQPPRGVAVSEPLSAALPLLLFGLPVFDTLMVMTQRLRTGRSPFAAGRDHSHHKLLALGLRHHEAVMALYVVQFAFVVLAYLFRSASDVLIVGLFLAFSTLLLSVHAIASRFRHAIVRASRRLQPPMPGARLQAGIGWLAVLAVGAYMLLAAAAVPKLTADLAVVVLLLLALQLVTVGWRRGGPVLWLERMVFYFTAATIIFGYEVFSPLPPSAAFVDNLFFAGLALLIVLGLRGTGTERFQANPLDILVLLIAVTLPNLGVEGVGLSIAKLITLFYGVELMIVHAERYRLVIRLFICVTLAVLATRGLAQ